MNWDSIFGIAESASCVLSVVALGFGFYVRATASKAADDKCRVVDGKLDLAVKGLYDRINADHDRLSRLEGIVDDMPRRDDVHKLSLQLSELSGDLKAINAKMEGIVTSSNGNAAALRRVEDHIFNVEK
jgi:hypothetical protein